MTEFRIEDSDLASLRDKVVVLTGCSSGIGLATTTLLLELGAKVVGGDLNSCPITHDSFEFVGVDVTSWENLRALFRKPWDVWGRVDCVFANAGIAPKVNYLDPELDENGEMLEPSSIVLDINLKAVINTVSLGLFYIRKGGGSGSIVMTASASSFQRFRLTDYTTAKHGVLGFMRGLVGNLPWPSTSAAPNTIRLNAIAPSWTATGMVPSDLLQSLGTEVQPASVPARSVALLMADENRQGQLIYSWTGRFADIEEDVLLGPVKRFIGDTNQAGEDEVAKLMVELGAGNQKAATEVEAEVKGKEGVS